MIEVESQRGMNLRLGQVRKTLQNLIHAHTELVIARNGTNRYARSFDDRHAARNARTGDNVRIGSVSRIHCFIISRGSNRASSSSASGREVVLPDHLPLTRFLAASRLCAPARQGSAFPPGTVCFVW